MRIRFWRRDSTTDALDPEVLSVFATSTRRPEIGPAHLANSRARVAAMLRSEPVADRTFRQRLAYGVIGGGGLWSSLVGAAAANKAATIVAAGVILAGGATAEVTGVGPAIREAVTPGTSAPNGGPTAVVETSTATATSVVTATATPGATTQSTVTVTGTPAAQVSPAPEDIPGNFVTQINPNGRFTLRGLIVAVDGSQLSVLTDVDDVPLSFDVNGASVQVPGKPGTTTLAGYEGHLVRITGLCEDTENQLTEDCTVETLTVLGNAGQDPPATQGQGQGQGRSDDLNDTGPPDNTGPPTMRGT